MKQFRLVFLLLLVIGFSTCDDDEIPPCALARWAGTYTGSADCNGVVEDATVTITRSGTDAIIISYETRSRTGNSGLLIPIDCDVNDFTSTGSISTTWEAELDGESITVSESVTGVGGDFSCAITAVR